TFKDNYQWLEDAADPAVQKWIEEQNRLTRSILDTVPGRAEIAARLTKVMMAPRFGYFAVSERGGRLFAMKSQPPKEQSMLVVLDSPSDATSERIVYDPNTADAKGSISMDFYVASLDGRQVAISLSRNGSEDGSVHIFDVATAKELGDVVPRVNFPTAGGSVAWNADGSGFWYTRYPQGDERSKEDINFYQQIWFHTVGTPASADTYAFGRDFPRIAEIQLTTSDDGHNVLASVRNGDGGEVAHWVRNDSGAWTQVTQFADQVRQADFGGDDALYLLSHQRAPNGKILRVTVSDPKLSNAEVVVDTSRLPPPQIPDGLKTTGRTTSKRANAKPMSIDDFAGGRNVLYVAMMSGGPSDLLTFNRSGEPLGRVVIPPVSSILGLVRAAGDELFFQTASYTTPPTWYRYDPATRKAVPAALRTSYPADFSDVVVMRELATSKDGTKIPINIRYRKGMKLDGTNPTILSGYGGYSISLRPVPSLASRVWFDAGGIIADANLRGGGEFGEAWHEAGKMLNKQNVFDDFAACARHLIARKYTNRSKLAIEGGSNGGLLMGAVLTQHPELFRAVVSHVGIYDVPRWLRTPNGVFNTTEFGSPDDARELRAIMAYSPYHHVVAGTRYPAVLLLTGDNDGRVDPMNSRKFAARLQEATGSANPILLRTTSKAGHGIGTALSEAVALRTDVYAFLWRELDLAAPR
ncbi:MAG TPA: prolyl oligopeptidase family serine peptidase, partial [Thermoanaerobaculia bacterium]|nr:prolyl oligopeptidase family serine peptidase [Thermoanaerobaculia bacterium]